MGRAMSTGSNLKLGVGEDVHLVRLPINRGYAAACNAIAQVAVEIGSEFVWFLNNDVEVDPSVSGDARGHAR